MQLTLHIASYSTHRLVLPIFHCRPNTPKLIAIEGPAGVGKSVTARQLARRMDCPFDLGVPIICLQKLRDLRFPLPHDWLEEAEWLIEDSLLHMEQIRKTHQHESRVILDQSVWTIVAFYCSLGEYQMKHVLAYLETLVRKHTIKHLPDAVVILEADFPVCQDRIDGVGSLKLHNPVQYHSIYHANQTHFYKWLEVALHLTHQGFSDIFDNTEHSHFYVLGEVKYKLDEWLPLKHRE